MKSALTLSVILPSRSRPTQLQQCLIALNRQSRFINEVILVENNQKKTYAPILSKFPKLHLRYVLEKNIGRSLARNRGLKIAKGDILAFLDDDAIVCSHWAQRIKTAFTRHNDIDVVLGASQEQQRTSLLRALEFQHQQYFLSKRVDPHSGDVKCGSVLDTKNFAIRAKFLRKNPVQFNHLYDQFGTVEDTQFGEELERLGAKMWYDQELIVLHKEESRLLYLLRKQFRRGRAVALLQSLGFTHDFPYSVADARLDRWLLIKEVWMGRRLPDFKFFLSLNLIVTSYRWGIAFEHLWSGWVWVFFQKLKEKISYSPKDLLHFDQSELPIVIQSLSPQTFVLFCESPSFCHFFLKNTHIYPDSRSGGLIAKMLGIAIPKQINTQKLFLTGWKRWQKENKKILFLGGTPQDSDQLFYKLISSLGISSEQKRKQQQNVLRTSLYHYQNIYVHHANAPDYELVEVVRKIRPEILIIGMESPRQEQWCHMYKDHLGCRLFWNMGTEFDEIGHAWKGERLGFYLEWWEKIFVQQSELFFEQAPMFWKLVILGLPLLLVFRIQQLLKMAFR